MSGDRGTEYLIRSGFPERRLPAAGPEVGPADRIPVLGDEDELAVGVRLPLLLQKVDQEERDRDRAFTA